MELHLTVEQGIYDEPLKGLEPKGVTLENQLGEWTDCSGDLGLSPSVDS